MQDMKLPQNNLRVKEGTSGEWKVEQYEIKDDRESSLFNLRLAIRGADDRAVTPGTYWKLLRGNTLVMSNTPAEVKDMREVVRKAKGKVLVNGLGLGIFLEMILAKPEVEHVTVIEQSQDVVNLVGIHYKDEPRVTIINESAFDYTPPKGAKYDVVWHDIWDYICEDNLPEMTKLHRKYGRRTDWQASWCRRECERLKNRIYW